jgi:hypothetical protein
VKLFLDSCLCDYFMRTLIVIFTLGLSTLAFPQGGAFTGKIVPGQSQFDFSYSEIQLFKDDCIVACTSIDHCGDFQFFNIAPGFYHVRVLIQSKMIYIGAMLVNDYETEQLFLINAELKGMSKRTYRFRNSHCLWPYG